MRGGGRPVEGGKSYNVERSVVAVVEVGLGW